jgi:dTDP-4-dehydrorhamnose reductase
MTSNSQTVILILGGSGLLGKHCYDMLDHKYRIITTYHSNALPNDNCVKFRVQDGLPQLMKLLAVYKPDVIINTIALVDVDGCETNPGLAARLNIDFVSDLVKSMKKTGLQNSHLIHISSDSVYGQHKGGNNKPWCEVDICQPISVYARTKLRSEEEALKHTGLVTIIRTAFYGINPMSNKGLLWWIIDNVSNGRVIDGWEDIYFSPVSALELVKLIRLMFEKHIAGIYNVSSIDNCNKFDFINSACKIIGRQTKINRVRSQLLKGQPLRSGHNVLCSDKLSSIVSWDVCWRNDLSQYLQSGKLSFLKN